MGKKGTPLLFPYPENSWIWTSSEADDLEVALLVCWLRKISYDTWPRCLRKDRKKGRPYTKHHTTVALAVCWVNKWVLYQLGVAIPHYFIDMVLFFIENQRYYSLHYPWFTGKETKLREIKLFGQCHKARKHEFSTALSSIHPNRQVTVKERNLWHISQNFPSNSLI